MRLAGILAIVAFAGIAVASFRGFNEFIEDKNEGMEYLQKYALLTGAKPVTGVAALDDFISLMVYMFRDYVLVNQTQWWIFAEWAAVFSALNWLNVEFVRKQMRLIWIYFLLWNIAGLAPFLALIMIYYVIATEKQVKANIPDRQVGAIHSLLTLLRVALYVSAPIILRLVPTKSNEYFFTIVAFMLVPSFMDILWAMIPAGPALKKGDGVISKALLQLSYVLAGIVGFGLHISESYRLVEHFGGFKATLSLLQGNPSAILSEITVNGATRLIMYDASLSLASVYVFIFYDGGLWAGLRSLITSVLIGPALTVALYFGNRRNLAASGTSKSD